MKKIETREELQKQGYYFTDEEINHLVNESEKIGFETDIDFDKEKIKGEIYFRHIRTDNIITIERWRIINKDLDILKDDISEIFITLHFDKIDNLNFEIQEIDEY